MFFFIFIQESLQLMWRFPSPIRNNVSEELLSKIGWITNQEMIKEINEKIWENNLTHHFLCAEYYLAYLSYFTGSGRWYFDKNRFDINNFTNKFTNENNNNICKQIIETNCTMRSFHDKLAPSSAFQTVYRYYSLFHSYFIVYCISENHICNPNQQIFGDSANYAFDFDIPYTVIDL